MSNLQEDLYEAIENSEINKVRRLLKKGADPNTPDKFGQTPLYKALTAYDDEAEKIAILLIKQGADVNAVSEWGEPILATACSRCFLMADRVVSFMLKQGADPNLGLDKGHAPIFKAVGFDFEPGYTDCFKRMVKAGAKLLIKDRSGCELLRHAALYGNTEMCKILIDSGYPIDGLDGDYYPLHGAIAYGSAELAQFFVENGATIDQPLPQKNGTPVKFAKSYGGKHRKVVAVLQAALGETPKPKKKAAAKSAAKKARSKTAFPKDIPSAWKSIEAWLKEESPLTRQSLNRKATDKQLDAAQKTIGIKFPKDLVAFYQAHNGQKMDAVCLVPADRASDVGYTLMSLTQGISEWKMWCELIDIGEFKGEKAKVSKGIRSTIWHEGWLPVASNGAGDSLCVDLAPTKAGQAGQIISVCHETNERFLVAKSVKQWLIDIAQTLEDGRWEIE